MSGVLSRLGFGGAPLGNLYTAVAEDDARAAVTAAWECGIRYFDTAPHYGLGLSERRIGDALRERPRAEFELSTKVGRLVVPVAPGEHKLDAGFVEDRSLTRRFDFSADGVRRSLESSLGRMGLDRVDIVFVHDPDDHFADAATKAIPALERMRAEGTVGRIGVGMNQTEMLVRFVRETNIDLVLIAGRYTLLDQSALDELLPACLERGVGVVAAGVFNGGILASDDVTSPATYDYRAAPASVVVRARKIATICARHGCTLPAAAMTFADAHPAVVNVLVGARTAGEIQYDASLFSTPPPEELWSELRAERLIREDAPS